MSETQSTYTVEYRIGGIWYAAAKLTAADLAEIALKAFRKAQPSVEWRLAA